jgi:predicted O-linked N-acetylglucosamine transferase (SPINDLY family)
MADDPALADIAAAAARGDLNAQFEGWTRLLRRYPTSGWALNHRAIIAQALGNRRGAEADWLAAIAAPGYGEVHCAHTNLAGLYLAEQRADAEGHAREAVRLAPTFADGWHNLGNVLARLGLSAEALGAYERAVHFGSAHSVGQAYEMRRNLCLWEGLEALEAAVMASALAQPHRTSPLVAFAYLPTTAAWQRQYAEGWASAVFGLGAPAPAPRARMGGKVRLGYLSADFYDHPTTHLLVGALEAHDRTRFEVVGLSIGPDRADDAGRRIRGAFDAWHDLFVLDDETAADAIRALGIDILMDLNGYTQGCRPGVLARRPAPVQINYLAWPGTMGAAFIDYIIADPIVAPDDADFTERVLRLPCYQPTDAGRAVAAAPERAALGLPEGALVIASMHRAWKLNPRLFDVWGEILRQAPGAVLWQWADAEAEAGLRAEARARGFEDRLVFAPKAPQPGHIARLARADLALDAFPCGGHTTTSDLLFAGVPVITLAGTSFCGRVAASLLTAAGLAELIAKDEADYIRKALALIAKPARLAALKQGLIAGRGRLPLFDTQGYARALEAALLSVLPA